MDEPKAAAAAVYKLAIEAEVNFPSLWDESKIRNKCGTIVMISKNDDDLYDVDCALKSLLEEYGDKKKRKDVEETADVDEDGDNDAEDTKKPKKQKKESTKPKLRETYMHESNRDIGEIVDQIGSKYFEMKENFKGGAYSKAAKSIREHPTPITGSAKDIVKMKIPKIGAGIASVIVEFRETGKVKKLEELIAG